MNGHGNVNGMVAPLPVEAKAAGLRYAVDSRPGIVRMRAGKGFRYVGPDGRPITNEATLKRIRALVIPPAWTNVWISTDPQSHLQATGRDARGRKQYRYHARWREVRHQTKFDRMVPFARTLPRIRRRVADDLRRNTLNKRKVVAAVVQLLEKTLVRVGNEEYARTNHSYGLTTLRDGHARVRGAEVRFGFIGKSGKRHDVVLTDARLARIVKRCQDLPGQDLFQYVDADGIPRAITSADVNAYLRDAAGADFTAKDFRTWAGTLLAATCLRGAVCGKSQRETKSTITKAIATVAQHLSNTPAVCRACYVHPIVLEAYATATLAPRLAKRVKALTGLSRDECAVLALLESHKAWPEQLAEAARVARRQRGRRTIRQADGARRSRVRRRSLVRAGSAARV
jgi:DNA topoisomerase I